MAVRRPERMLDSGLVSEPLNTIRGSPPSCFTPGYPRWQFVTRRVTRFRLHTVSLIVSTTLPCASGGKVTVTRRVMSLLSLRVPFETVTLTVVTRTIDPAAGQGFDDLGRSKRSAFTVSRTS